MPLLSGSLEYVSIQQNFGLQNSNFYVKHWEIKKEKFLLDIQTKCDNIANEILNAAIDEQVAYSLLEKTFLKP